MLRRARFVGVALLAVALCTGCYTTRTVRGEELPNALKEQIDEGVALPGADGPPTRLGPASLIRVRRKDGTVSRWFAARNLKSRDDGLSVTMTRAPLTAVREATVSGMSPEHALLLESTAPATGAIEHRADGMLVLHPGDTAMAAWIGRFIESRRGAGGPIAPTELWTFNSNVDVATVAVPGTELEASSKDGILVVDGLPWSEITAVEVKNLDGFMTWFTVVSSPVWVGGVLLLGALGGGFGNLSVDATAESTRAAFHPPNAATPEEEPLTDVEILHGGVLNTSRHPTFSAEGWHPLFTESAVRKSRLRPMAWVGLGGELTTGRSSTFLLGAGVRVWDIAEFGIGTDSWWADPFGLSPNLPGIPLAPGPSRYVPNVIVFFHGGADFDLDAWKRISLPLALEVGYGTGNVWQFRLAWGARVRIVKGVFLGLHPFNPQFTSARVGGTSTWSFPSFVEVGSTF